MICKSNLYNSLHRTKSIISKINCAQARIPTGTPRVSFVNNVPIRFDFFKKSKDESSKSSSEKSQKPLTRQKSVEQNPSPKVQDYFKALTSKDKSKSVSVKNVHNLASPTSSFNLKGVRKSDKMLAGDKTAKAGFGQKKISKKEEKNANRDDFLKATMRIFLVVSPPVGKIQVNRCWLTLLCLFDYVVFMFMLYIIIL